MKKNPWIRTAVCAALAALVFALCRLAPQYPQTVERVYSQCVYKLWAVFSSLVPASRPRTLAGMA